ncbi:MAG TPA: hypothetical protein VNN72_17690, partial [Polyangiaceae bacterium]|nr:hypothetical protein [Polyangiaceae bacterium]
MNGAVMGAAKRDEIFRVVVAAFGPKPDVVRLDKDRVSAPGNATFPAVPAQDRAPSCRGDGLGCSDGSCVHMVATVCHANGAHVCVNVSEVLPVALRHLDDFGTDLDGFAAPLLRRPAAALANRERDLIARAPRFPVPVEGLTA